MTTATKFELSNPDKLPITMICAPTDTSNTIIGVSTASASFTLPDLTAIGLPLPATETYTCGALASGSPGAAPDTLVSGEGPIVSRLALEEFERGGPDFAANGAFIRPPPSLGITFTTK